MAEKSLRIALIGAATLLGKALNDELSASAFASADFRLMDDDAAGTRNTQPGPIVQRTYNRRRR